MEEVPIRPLPWQEFSVLLNGQQCIISLYVKGKFLYMDLYKEETVVAQGCICLNKAIINQSPSHLFNGVLFFLDTQGEQHPHYEELGTRYILLYITTEEREELVDSGKGSDFLWL